MHYSAFDSNGQCTSAISFKSADVHFVEKCFGPLSLRKVAPSILSFRRTRIISVTIRRLDPSIHAVDDQFCFLVLTDFSTCIHSLLLCFIMTARSLSTATFDIPSTVGIMNNMMRFSCHKQFTPYALWGSRLRIHQRHCKSSWQLVQPALRCHSSQQAFCC